MWLNIKETCYEDQTIQMNMFFEFEMLALGCSIQANYRVRGIDTRTNDIQKNKCCQARPQKLKPYAAWKPFARLCRTNQYFALGDKLPAADFLRCHDSDLHQ